MSDLALGAGWKTLTVSLGLMSTNPGHTPDGVWMLTWEATDKRASTPGYSDRMSFFIVTDLESGFAGRPSPERDANNPFMSGENGFLIRQNTSRPMKSDGVILAGERLVEKPMHSRS